MTRPTPTVHADGIAWISETEMIEVDRAMVEDLGIELLQMMENAGRTLARLVLDGWNPRRVNVAVGSGGNGGGGMVAARHLANAGLEVTVVSTRPGPELLGVPAHQFQILQRMGVATVSDPAELPPCDVMVDAIIGYSLRGAPGGASASLIAHVNGWRVAHPERRTVVALDTPSGLDVTTGVTPGDAVSADATLTLCLPKRGLRASPLVGELFVADISVPPSITGAYGSVPDFRQGPMLRVIDRA